MPAADKVGLLPGFDLVAGHGLATLIICWLLTPVGMVVVGMIGESRIVPLSSDKQFQSFFPGDVFLGVAVASLLEMARHLPARERWYNATWWHVTILVIAAAIAAMMTWMEASGIYPKRAILSPTKIYHNGLLYVGYGYVAVASLVAVIAGSDWSRKGQWQWMLLVVASGGVWVVLAVRDNSLSPAEARAKARFAHVADWHPIWRRRT